MTETIMKNSIETFFKWKMTGKQSVEEKNKENLHVKKWGKVDVLYSFIGIYTIGIYVFYKNECKRTNYKIKTLDNTFFSTDYLANHYSKYPKLNKIIEDVGYIEVYDAVGNIIPVWPGANVDRGIYAHCFDIPEIYFGNMNYKWFEILCDMYPDASLKMVLNKDFVYGTKTFLDGMNEEKYVAYLEHVVDVISKRTIKLNSR